LWAIARERPETCDHLLLRGAVTHNLSHVSATADTADPTRSSISRPAKRTEVS
jgi:hypothetical protein